MFGLGHGHSLSLAASRPLSVPFVGEFDELGSDGTTLRWTAMAGASSYVVEAFGAADLSGGVLGTATTTGTSLLLAALSLSAGNYWIRVKAVQGALEKVWRDGGLPVAIGSGFTDLVGWATSSIWVYCRDNPFVVTTPGVVTGITPPTGHVVVTGGASWTTGSYPVDGSAKDYVYDPGALSMLHLPGTFAPNGTGGGIGYWQPYVTPSKQVIWDGDSLMNCYAAGGPIESLLWYRALYDAGRKWADGGNYAVNGQTAANALAGVSSQIVPLFNSSLVRNSVAFWGGTNDLYGGATAAATIASIKSYCTILRTAGFYVIVITMLPRTESGGSFTMAARAVVNAELLNPANVGVYWDAVADTTADARLEDETNTTYFQADQTHLYAAGDRIVGGLVGNLLKTL